MQLYNLLRSWIVKSPKAARDALLRIFILYSSRIENQEPLLDALYGQGVLGEEQYWELVRTFAPRSKPRSLIFIHFLTLGMQIRKPKNESYPHYKAQEAILASIDDDAVHLKELVVALEWSKNETVLESILRWAEDKGFETTDVLDSPEYFMQ